ncbi:cellulose synthase [Altererythrobacter sp. B11]|uniref:UDP-forming cellulose synthase catalytic subunit n=1 Tax=Altererythrobacter sp. B11 TaxID=2060312 RepID=UPI000DC6F68C|nr:UDP-forming cellulose synthase catalytic subunit [Altererythrobacter sp. B11]BBC71896.1 cellulose synthase [Altererythrobacter sp. B11]
MPLSRLLRFPAAIALAFLAALVIFVPLDLVEQWTFAAAVIIAAVILAQAKGRRATIVLAAVAMLVSTRYIVWRTTQTLEFNTLPELLLGGGLYLAELYAWVIMGLGFLQTIWPLERKVVEVMGEPDQWPMVDVFIPTYNESLEIVKHTVFAAMDMDYPADRFRVFILDDGRRDEFRLFAKQAGCGYLTRSDNLHAKAGNLNAAMKKTDGELIAIFDCDHVPTRAFLQLSVGWFQRDPRLALMQTPHHFYSPDPVQRNLSTAEDLPGEGDLFYGPVQRGNDLWNATFFCGSCAIIRREALMQTNGFAGETVTEDAHTALKLQRMGWNTAYLDARLSAGLATERLVLHIGQRIRWARGMTQILRIDNPLRGPGLTWQQRLCYLNAMLHFQFPLPRIVFLTSPLAYLIAGQNIIHASALMIFAYALPHLVISMISSERLQGGDRRPFWGEIYETILAFHLVRPTVFTWFQPRKGKFNVTDKGGLLDRTYFDLDTVRPHMITIGLLVFGLLFGLAKYLLFPEIFAVQLSTLALNTAWATFSLIILLAAVSVAREKRQVREHIRVPTDMPVTIYFDDGHVVEGRTVDISLGGVSARLPAGFNLAGREVTDVSLPMGDEALTVPVETMRTDKNLTRLRFGELDQLLSRQLVRAVMGRADAWQREAPYPPTSTLRSLGDIVKVDFTTLRLIVGRKKAPPAATLAKAAAIALAVALGVLAAPQDAFAQPTQPAATASRATGPSASRSLRMTLKDLAVKQPVRLAGTRGEIGIPFGIAENEVVTKARFTLTFAYSPSLLQDLSQMVVLVNGETVDTVRLARSGSDGMTVTMDVQPALFLPGENRLNLRFLGHYTRDCEDPFHSSLWANVSNTRSFLDLQAQRLALPPDLAKLPRPFFEKASVLPLNLPFVFAGTPDDAELEAAASMASWFGSLASYRGFRFPVSFGSLPAGNAIVFMTPNRRVAGLDQAIDGPSVVVRANPRDPYGQLLVIMGRNTQELKQAAAGLPFATGLAGGGLASLDGIRIPGFAHYGAPRWLPTDRPIALGQLTEAYALQGQGLPPGPLTAEFRLAPDLFFWPKSGARLDLRYRYPTATWLDQRASRLDVSVNNQYLQTLPLSSSWWGQWWDNPGATSRTSAANLILPSYNLFGQNQLIFDYNLILANMQRCQGRVPDNVRVSILPTSEIDLSGAYHAMRMPDLSTFVGGGYPFTVQPDLAETAVILPGNAGQGTVEAFLMVMGRFGDSTGTPVTRADVMRQADAERLRAKDILVIGPAGLAGSSELFDGAPVRFDQDRLQVSEGGVIDRGMALFSDRDRDEPTAVNEVLYSTDHFLGMAGFQSPFDSDRSVVAVLATDTNELPGMITDLEDVDVIAGVQGDLSLVRGDGMTSFVVGPDYWVGELPWWVSIGHWFSRHPLLLALAGLIVALLVAGPIYAVLQRQQRKRLQNEEG